MPVLGTGIVRSFRPSRGGRRLLSPGMNGHTRIERKGAFRNATGDDVNLISYLPTAITTLFALAAGLLLGYIQ